MDDIIKTDDSTIIFNGGTPLPGCPVDWEDAKKIEGILNGEVEDWEKKWAFDCGFKLDYSNKLITLDARFYPPKKYYGPTWDGKLTISVLGKEILVKEFDCDSLDKLKSEVDREVQAISTKIQTAITEDFFKS